MDPTVHLNLSVFIPERFAAHPSLAPQYAAGDWQKRDHYGYDVGRRICSGIHLAERNMFLFIAKLLWAFRFEKLTGANETMMSCDEDSMTGYQQEFLYCAKRYECKPVLRSEKVRKTVTREFEEAERKVFNRFSEG